MGIARRYTGKTKIMSPFRSYHGGSSGTLSATGDFRRHLMGTQEAGFVKIVNPYTQCFSAGTSDEAAAELVLGILEEQIPGEGPDTIAAILHESIPGSPGVLVPPVGYMEGVRALCDKYNILLICDEVMVGFWRTGPMFAFQHFKGVVPDIVTSAKGLTASFLPLGLVGVRQKIQDYFETSPLGWGATYANHPVLLACAYHTVRKNVQARMHERVAKLEPILLEEVNALVRDLKCVRQGRVIGAFGCLDLVKGDGSDLNVLGQALSTESAFLQQALHKHGLMGLFRAPMLHIAPPLVITEDELRELFARLRRALQELEAKNAE